MNIRIMGATDQIKKLQSIFQSANIESKIYANRGTTKTKRLYINLDDREAEELLNKFNFIPTIEEKK